jgi:flagellar biosynthesis protein FlhG
MISVNGLRDQASGLRGLRNKQKPVRVIAVTSGKGGVGKTSVSVNLAMAMANVGKNVMLMDADLGLANIDVMLGLHPTHNLSHVVSGSKSLNEIIVEGPLGVQIVPAASGTQFMSTLSDAEHAGLIRAFSELNSGIDTLIIDTAAGITPGVVSFCKAAQEILVVVCDEPASITDAYATIKLMSRDYHIQKFHVLANKTQSAQEGRALFDKLSRATDRFLDVTLNFVGVIPFDDSIKKAVQRQKSVVDAFPRSRAAIAFKNLAQKADKWPMPAKAAGHLEFFIERLIQASQISAEAAV